MSTLTENLQTIYEVKQQLKQVIGTSSDIFEDYPSYISNMVTPTGTINISENGTTNVSTYAYAYVSVSGGAPSGSAYFYVVRNPEEENEEIIPFTDYTAQAGYPCFGYNFGNFEYTQGEGAQQVIFPMNSEEEGVDKTAIRTKIESPLFSTDGEDPVDVYAAGPSTIETSNDSAEAQVIIDQFGSGDAGDAPAVYIARSISNLEYYIEKTNSSYTWSGRWEWQ